MGVITAWTIQCRGCARPREMEFIRSDCVFEIVAAYVSATKFHGLAHVDLRLDSRSGAAVVLEVNPRVYASINLSAWAGVNFPALGHRMATGVKSPQVFEAVESRVFSPFPSPTGWIMRRFGRTPESYVGRRSSGLGIQSRRSRRTRTYQA